MALDPLHCLGAMVFAGMTTRRTDDNSQPAFRRWILGVASGVVVGLVGGMAGGYLGSAIALAQHEVKLEQLKERQAEDRSERRVEIRALSDRLRDLELRRLK